MSHFHANPLSIFLTGDLKLEDIPARHIEGARNIPSFRKYAESCLGGDGDAVKLKSMLDGDGAMLEAISTAIGNIQQALTHIATVIPIIQTVQRQFLRPPSNASSLYIKGISGELAESPTVRELLLSVKKTPSDILSKTLEAIHDLCPDDQASDLEILTNRLNTLISEDVTGQPLRSEHDIRNDTVRTTVVAQKVQLSRHKAKLSEKDEAYSKIISAFHDLLSDIFKTLQNPLEMFGHEIVIYDLKTPHRAALIPKPRFAIERALSSPHDYLNCRCCADAATGRHGEEASLTNTLPPAALLYRLYLESGALINGSDLWSAFAAVMECESDEEREKVM